MEIFKNITKCLITPVLLLSLLAVFTLQLLNERAVLTAAEQPEWHPGVGPGRPQLLQLAKWQPIYGGGVGIDEVVARQDKSLRISTGGDGGWYGAYTALPDTDFAHSALAFSFRVFDWTEVERVMILLATNDSFVDYYGVNLTSYFADPAPNEWRDLVLDPAEFVVVEGSPTWEEVTHLAVRVIPRAGVSTRVWFDEFALVPQTESEAIVSITFDDGFASTLTAAEFMGQYGLFGTAYIIPEFLGTEGYLQQVEVDQLAASGWDISGHGKDNLTTLPPTEVDTQLALMQAYLATRGYQGATHFAYPNGVYNLSVQSQVSEYFSSARTIDGFMQSPEYWYPTHVNAVTISSSTPVTAIKQLIDKAVAEKTWLILVWHDLQLQPTADVEYHPEDFAYVIQYLASNEIEVLPYSLAYEKLLTGGKNEILDR